MTDPLIDCHAHFLHALCGRSDWQEVNAARFRAGEKIGISCHVASVLGTYGFRSPTYFPSPEDVTLGNDAMLTLCKSEGKRVAMMVTVNPNHTKHCARRNRAMRDGGRSGGEAAREPASGRPAARPDLRACGETRPSGSPSHLAAPPPRVAQSGNLRRCRSRTARRAASERRVHSCAHRRRR